MEGLGELWSEFLKFVPVEIASGNDGPASVEQFLGEAETEASVCAGDESGSWRELFSLVRHW